MPTYLKLLNFDEKMSSTQEKPKYLLDYLKYVRIIHFKYYQAKRGEDQMQAIDAGQHLDAPVTDKAGGRHKTPPPQQQEAADEKKKQLAIRIDNDILYSSDDYSAELKDLESSGSVDIEYAKAEELADDEQADGLLENVLIKVEPEKVSRKELKKKQDADTRRQIVDEVKKTGLKKMFQESPD